MSSSRVQDLPVPFHTALFLLRREHRLSQEAVAKRAGITPRGYRKLERGLTRNPNNSTWRGLATAFGMTVPDIQKRLIGRVVPHGGVGGRLPTNSTPHPAPQRFSPIAERIAAIVEELQPLDGDFVLGVCLQLQAIRHGGHEIYSVFGPQGLRKDTRRRRH